ncbi:signal peptidase II [Nocardioides gansuensis]|uniref:Lipoprotein signal peptidase n=1 Tax=Nocardioides gansuensis TaxID=2138300 RepID=A0A2T8FAT5_9ACTN|nr:signal peptidase II [Nocardioides gansuensis]PVG82812.1 signal peptidase II [Nocardioides gansuensis]
MQAARGASLTTSDPATTTAPTRPRRARAIFGLVALAAYVADLASKQWALSALADRDIHAVGDLLVFHLTHNPGAAFSTGAEFTVVFSSLSIVAVLVVLWVVRKVGSPLWALALGLLLGGVGGNLTDRLVRDPGPMRGHVVDFLMLPHWPVFNIADMCINAAAVLIVVQTFRGMQVDGRRVEPHR